MRRLGVAGLFGALVAGAILFSCGADGTYKGGGRELTGGNVVPVVPDAGFDISVPDVRDASVDEAATMDVTAN